MAVSVVVEDGSGVSGANAYLSIEDWKGYADQHGWDYSTAAYSDDQIGSAIIRGRAWLDATYRSRWPGSKVSGRDQSTDWPRRGATDADGEDIAEDEIPQEVIDASAEAAWRELQAPNSLAPDLERGGAIESLQAGSVAIKYAGTAPVTTTFTIIDGLLASILISGGSSPFTARAVRA